MYLYHGSPYLFDTLKPQKANDNTDAGSQYAIYACARFDDAIPFALPIRWYPDDPSGKRAFTCDNGLTVIEYGSLDPNGFGYVYKLNIDGFVQVDDWQWVSPVAATPIEVTKIAVRDYWHTITFSNTALRINDWLYPM